MLRLRRIVTEYLWTMLKILMTLIKQIMDGKKLLINFRT
jgi:hypothetical protein